MLTEPAPLEAAELIEEAIEVVVERMKDEAGLPEEASGVLEKVALADALLRWTELINESQMS